MKFKTNKWQQWWLDYFDWNKDGKTNWWEYLIPFLLILSIEVIAEIIAKTFYINKVGNITKKLNFVDVEHE